MNPTHRLSQQGLYQPRMPRGEKSTSWSPTVRPVHNDLSARAHCLLWILSLHPGPCGQSLDTYNKVSAPAEHLSRHTTVRAGRILGIQDVTGKQADVDGQSLPVVPPLQHPTLETQVSQSEPVQVTSFHRQQSAGPGSHGREQPLPNKHITAWPDPKEELGAHRHTHELGTSRSPGLLRRLISQIKCLWL